MTLNKPIDQITEADLQQLISYCVAEAQTIEYKKELKVDNEKDKAEFRKDISSLANASGGHLIAGMAEANGVPIELCGMDIPNPNGFKLQLEALLQNKITPRIPGVSMEMLPLSNGNSAVIIHIPQSFAKPHQIENMQATSNFLQGTQADVTVSMWTICGQSYFSLRR